MLYKRIWDGDKLRSYGGEEYIDHELVLSASKGDYDQVERLVKVLRDAPKHFKMPNESNTTSSGTSARSEEGPRAPTADGKMIGSVMFGQGDEKELEFKTAYAALHAACACGHKEVVEQLLDDDLGALQAAAEGGHVAVVKMLLDHGAAIRDPEPVAEWDGRTTFQAAAGAGHTKIVELLLLLRGPTNTDNVRNIKGDILKAPGGGNGGRTALQAAAEGGHLAMVELLLEKGADISQAAPERNGRTALQAAAGAVGEELKEMVELLLEKGANVNDACAGDGGRSALQAAAEVGHEGIVKLLLERKAKNGSDEHTQRRGHFGLNPSPPCREEGEPQGSRDFLKKADNLHKEIRDNISNTPLQRALQGGPAGDQSLEYPTEIVKVLPLEGASTDRIPTSEFEKVMLEASEYEKESNDCIIVSDDPKNGRTIKAASWSEPPAYRSFHMQRKDHGFSEALLLRSSQLDSTSKSAVQWLTSSWSNSEDDPMGFRAGVPDNEQMLRLRSSSVLLVGYVCFGWPSGKNLDTSSAAAPAPLKGKSEEQVRSFDPGAQEVEISWIMRKGNKSIEGECMKGISYRASFPLKTFGLPVHGIEFVTWFLCEVNDRWKKLICDAESHQARRRMYQLREAGKNQNTILSLLEDSHEWTRLHGIWQEHLKKAKDLVEKFKDCKALEGEPTDNNPRKMTVEKPLDAFEKGLKTLEDRGKALSQIDKDNKELIQLEFNLVSIHEARRSLEMARSMKRLSWITFIFLPLMFIAGLFGMNVDVLSDNPPWQWYLVVSGPFTVLVIITSILCRNLSSKKLVEKIDKTLMSIFSSDISGPSDAGNAQYDTQVTREQGPGNEMDKITPFCMRWRRKTAKPENDPESIPHSV
ncbi:hypothetical protein DFP73DRAFT_591034 [Morchella snyderi]|nr:hypothetical protein DFP73DRAFT_591034 [Morchella snyderi]